MQGLLCKSCGLCAEYCPRQLMKPATEVPADCRHGPVINSAGHVVYEIHDPDGKCTGCGICANACPEGAVVVYRGKGKPKDTGGSRLAGTSGTPAAARASGKEASRG